MSDLLKKIRKYIQIAHDSAEARHDAYGEDYMSSGLWGTMLETRDLLRKIDKELEQEENE